MTSRGAILPPEQEAIRAKCFHPSGEFIEFPESDIEQSITSRFEKIVRLFPDQLALKQGDRWLTYDQLNQAANRIAHLILTQRGRGAEPIGLYLQDKLRTIVALLGILKAGKFLIPLDPSYPIARNRFVLKDCGPEVILTDSTNIQKCLEFFGQEFQCFIMDEAENTSPDDNPGVSIPADSIAFIVHTSGSTGDFKGIAAIQGHILHEIRCYVEEIHLSRYDRLTLLHSLSFRASELHLFGSLLTGASLFPYDVAAVGVGGIINWLRQEEITVWHSIPTLFRPVAEMLSGEDRLSRVRLVHLSGAPVVQNDLENYRKYFSQECIFLHRIGATETQTMSWRLFDHKTTVPPGPIPLGWPPQGKQHMLLDERGQEVGLGEVGEIALKSPLLPHGYWKKPELSNEKFRSADDKGQRIYLTGDLGRITPEHGLVVLGRKDLQLKIRGFRIEPEQVENALRSHPGVKEAVVMGEVGKSEAEKLVAFFTSVESPGPNGGTLRAYLKEKLPDYMIPSVLVQLDKIPLTANGKLDRQGLPRLAKRHPDLDTVYVEPSSAFERQLVEIWQDVLEVRPIGVQDDFFELGGNSLLAMRILVLASEAFKVDMSMNSFLDARTVAKLAEQIEHRRAIKEQTDPMLDRLCPLAPTTRGDAGLVLSYAEEGLWLIEQIRPGMTAWNMQLRLRLRGSLNEDALKRGLNKLIQRHESLRTGYRFVDGKLLRFVLSALISDLPCYQVDPSVDADTEITRISTADEKQSFDLAEPPLFRTRLVRINELDHVLIVTQHHIITDAWSSNVFVRELSMLYDAYSKGHASPLVELTLQYSDYALWSRQSVQVHMSNQLSYWREKLKGSVVQEIPTDKDRSVTRDYRGAQNRVLVSSKHYRALGKVCKEEKVTLFMLLVAVFKILLSRYTGSADIVVGAALAGRSRPELENLMGMFVNILPLRTDLSGQPTFRELLRRVRETCLEAYEHQDMPFEKLVEELNPNRGPSRNPFFQVLFNVVNSFSPTRVVDGLTIEPMRRPDDTARFDLTLYAPQTRDGIEIIAAYNRGLFFTDRIVEMLEQYKYLLEQIVDNPDQPIDLYSLVTLSAKRVLPDPIVALDDTWRGSVHELIAHYAQKRPDKVAVEDPFVVWSYKELNDRSNQVAHYLVAQGIKGEDIVAVYGQRGAVLVCALLGVLKAGAAFCVIDPSHPARRVREYLSATVPKALIEISGAENPNAELEEALKNVSLHRRIVLPGTARAEASQFLSQYSMENPEVAIGPDNLAYVIFTSGSTGNPKGVMGRHGPLTHFLPWLSGTFGLSENDRFSFLSSISTNKLQREIFTALSVGGTLCIPSADDIGTLGKLDEWLRTKQISVVHLTPAMAQLLDDTARESVPSVRRVFFGGDLLQMRDVDRAKKLMPSAEIVNFYNSSETQRGGGYVVFSKQRMENQKEIPPLGQGVKDVQLLVLNQSRKTAGIGELGEICIRSPHMARGYLRDEALTKERFIVNPYTGIESDRVYRTGEFGSYLPDGSVEFVARGENRFSVRGFRIELSEIESVLSDYPAIEQAVVVGEMPSERLVAYLKVRKGQFVVKHEVRGFLRTRLPKHMVPALFVPMDSIPLTATGKVDRDALPRPNDKDTQSEKEYVSPRNQTERSLCRVWSEVLGVDRVGIDDDFFDLGGHSLLAARLFRRLDDQFGRSFPLGILFSASTVRTLAENYSMFKPREKSSVLVTICASGTLPPLYAVPGLFGNVVGFADLSRELGSDQPFYGLQSAGLDGIEAPLDSIEEMAARYVREVRMIQPHGPYTLIGACFGGTVAFEMTRQLLNVGEEVTFLGLLDPTRRERNGAHKNPASKLRTFKRITALNSLLTDRLRLYREEMRGLVPSDRVKYATHKLFSLISKIRNNNKFTATARELRQIEVYCANISAHRSYRRKPLCGRLRAFEIFESNHPRNNRGRLDSVDWDGQQVGQIKRLRVPGKDSGDMVSGENARVLAALLSARLRAAYESPPTVAVLHPKSLDRAPDLSEASMKKVV